MNFFDLILSVSGRLSLRFALLAERCNSACWRRNHTYALAVGDPQETDAADPGLPAGLRFLRWKIGLKCDNCEQIINYGLSGVPCVAPFFALTEVVGDAEANSLPYVNQTMVHTGLSLTMPPNEDGNIVIEFSETGSFGWYSSPHAEIEHAIDSLDDVEQEFEQASSRFARLDTDSYRKAFKRKRKWLKWRDQNDAREWPSPAV